MLTKNKEEDDTQKKISCRKINKRPCHKHQQDNIPKQKKKTWCLVNVALAWAFVHNLVGLFYFIY